MANYPQYFQNQNPYMQQTAFNQPQQPILPSIQPQVPIAPTSGIVGRFVGAESEITAQDVAMGVTPSLFPLADGSAIISKQWANDGTIKTIRYTAEIDEPAPAVSVSLVDIVNQLNNMQDMLEAIQDTTAKPTTSRRTTKKEADDAEAK